MLIHSTTRPPPRAVDGRRISHGGGHRSQGSAGGWRRGESDRRCTQCALRHRYTYVFTTGAIGPTHGDITADCVAKAFGVSIDTDQRALDILHIGMQLGKIAKANPGVAIGSYPFFDPQHGPNTNVVLRARDAQKLAQAKREVEEMLERVRRAQSNS